MLEGPRNLTFLEAKTSNKIFSEEERFKIYHKIEGYRSVKKFIEKKTRNSDATAKAYKTGLCYFEFFLNNNRRQTIETLVTRLQRKPKEAYNVIGEFVHFMIHDLKKSTTTINSSLKSIKGLLRSEMITLDSKILQESASVPKSYYESEGKDALDKATVSKILQSVKIRRLRVFLFCLASSGCRVGELASIKWSDINLDSKPVSIHLRPETTKTRTGRTVFVSDEAKEELEQWRKFKQDSYAEIKKEIGNDELVFLTQRRDFKESHPEHIVHRVQISFVELLESLGIGVKKQQYDKSSRHTITPHSFRKFFKTQVSLEAKEPDLAEMLIGHKSLSQTYFRVSAKEVAKIYYKKLMPYLTFCDVASLEESRNDIAQELAKKDLVIASTQRQMEQMKQQMDLMNKTQEELKLLLKNPRRLVEILDKEAK